MLTMLLGGLWHGAAWNYVAWGGKSGRSAHGAPLVFGKPEGARAAVRRALGSVASVAIIKLLPIVLTLPGLAGMILTLGVAADANIVIFERVKEEIRAGRVVGRGDLRRLGRA